MPSTALDVSVSRGSALRVPFSLKGSDGVGISMVGVTKLLLSVKADTDEATSKIIEIDHKDFIDPDDVAADGLWHMRVPAADNDITPGTYWYQWTIEGLAAPLDGTLKIPKVPAKYVVTPTCD